MERSRIHLLARSSRRIVLLLVWKTILMRWRRKVELFGELLYPMLFLLVSVSSFRGSTTRTDDTQSPVFDRLPELSLSSFCAAGVRHSADCVDLALVLPSDRNLLHIVPRVQKLYNNSLFIRLFDSETELESFHRRNGGAIWGAGVLEHSTGNAITLKTRTVGDRAGVLSDGSFRRDGVYERVYGDDDETITLRHTLLDAILSVEPVKDSVTLSVAPFPSPRREVAMRGAEHAFIGMLFMSLSFSCFHNLVNSILQEHVKMQRDLLIRVGVSSSQYWVGWFFGHGVFATVMGVSTAILVRYGHFISHHLVPLPFLCSFFVLFSLSLVSWGELLAALTLPNRTPSSASRRTPVTIVLSTVVILMFSGSFIVLNLVLLNRKGLAPLKLLVSIFPTIPFGQVMYQLFYCSLDSSSSSVSLFLASAPYPPVLALVVLFAHCVIPLVLAVRLETFDDPVYAHASSTPVSSQDEDDSIALSCQSITRWFGGSEGLFGDREGTRLSLLPRMTNLLARFAPWFLPPGQISTPNCRTVAVSDVSMRFARGSIVVLLGPNGAGKSTLLSVLAGVVPTSQGSVSVGRLADDHLSAPVGWCAQEDVLFGDLTVCEHLVFVAGCKGKDFPVLALCKDLMARVCEGWEFVWPFSSIKWVRRAYQWRLWSQLSRLSLDDDGCSPSALGATALFLADLEFGRKNANCLVSQLSGGYQRKVALSSALINFPPILLLDEPTASLDIAGRRCVWNLLEKARALGCFVLLNTHSLSETDAVADSVVILSYGRVLARGAKASFSAFSEGGFVLRVVCNDESSAYDVDFLNDLRSLVREKSPGDISAQRIELSRNGRILSIRCDVSVEECAALCRVLEDPSGRWSSLVNGISLHTASVKDTFLHLFESAM